MQQGKKRQMPAYHNVSHIADIDLMGNAEIIIGR